MTDRVRSAIQTVTVQDAVLSKIPGIENVQVLKSLSSGTIAALTG
ncbi:unnamed protein product [Nezara viridula]|uniref:Uncharacterized protein n=1 Tax=Nezara viridula TaxID=85310 RepID=A0A9P0E3Q8_NEZVI|nr:unnamed protein product [Nezara viridula]